MKIFHAGSHQFWESLRELLRELWVSYCSSRGIPGYHSENGISNSESSSENIPELSESSENGLFHSESVFPEIGVVPRLLMKFFIQKNPRAHKSKSGTPPKTRNFMDMEVFVDI